MMFADDLVLSRQNNRELEEDLEIWRNALKRRGLKVSRSKTEYLRVGGVNDGEELKLQGEKVKRAKNFKNLGLTVSNHGRCEEVRRRIQAGWIARYLYFCSCMVFIVESFPFPIGPYFCRL